MTEPDLQAITAAWDTAARGDGYRAAIHPAGVDAFAYDASGEAEAHLVGRLVTDYVDDRNPGLDPLIVMDFGCGDGRVLQHFPTWWLTTGADASEGMLDRLHEQHPDVGRLHWDASDALADDRGYDVIYTQTVLIHHSISDGVWMTMQLADALRPGGLLLLGVPVYDVARQRAAWNDVTVWTPDLLAATAAGAGCEILESHVCPGEFSFAAIGVDHGAIQVLRRTR